MRKDVMRRLDRAAGTTEAIRRARRPEDGDLQWFAKLWAFLLAVHLSELQPHEAVAQAYARTLGYARVADLDKALRDDFTDVQKRHAAAMAQLQGKFGVDLANDDTATVAEALDRMMSAVPLSLRDRCP
jgi:hypothetical protein